MPFPLVNGLVPISLVQPDRIADTTLSAVIDREDFDQQTTLLVLLHMGASMLATSSGFDIHLFDSDTVSATASGMTAITSGNTSGETFTTSGQFMGITMDMRDKGRFIGVTLCAPALGSATASVTAFLADGAQAPAVAARDGFVTVKRIGQ